MGTVDVCVVVLMTRREFEQVSEMALLQKPVSAMMGFANVGAGEISCESWWGCDRNKLVRCRGKRAEVCGLLDRGWPVREGQGGSVQGL